MRFGFRELIFVLLLVMVLGVFYVWVLRDIDRNMAAAHVDIAEKRQKLQRLERATTAMDDLGGEIDKLTAAIEMFEKKLPAQREVEVILKQVWELASDNRLTPRSVRTDKLVPAADYGELPINMTIVGDFDGFYSFLLKLEKLPRITRIKTMKLERLSGDDKNGQMQAEVVLSIFFESAAEPGAASARAPQPQPASEAI